MSLTVEQINENRIKFLEIMVNSGIDIKATGLIDYLDNIQYFSAPYSTKYFRAYDGGLCETAIQTYHEMKRLGEIYCPNKYTEADYIIVALFKNIYKAEMYERYVRNAKVGNEWVEVIDYRTRETSNRHIFGDLGFSSFRVANHFTALTDEQTEAICFSSLRDTYTSDFHDILKTYSLAAIALMAELAVSYLPPVQEAQAVPVTPAELATNN